MEWLGNILNGLADFVFSLLPNSPFTGFLNLMSSQEWLIVLNWICPIATFISIGAAWLTCVGVYYLYSIILRYIKAVE